jgi:hypothetical protein
MKDRCARLAVAAVLTLMAACTPAARPVVSPGASVVQTAPPSPSEVASASPAPSASSPEEPTVLVGAGDIADCGRSEDESTATLLDAIDGTVIAIGDLVYPAGNDATYAECYGSSWGRHLDRTRPAVGNHDAQDDGGAAYFRYFGDRAGTPGEGWYAYEAGAWHVIVLNSNCELVGGCGAGSPQDDWLLADLAAGDAACTLAYWHHPRFSSGPHGGDPRVAPFWQALYDADADLVLAGHDHIYERFAPQDPNGQTDAARGIRQLTAGTGGKDLYAFEHQPANSELAINDRFGVLELTLTDDAYAWRFVAAPDASVLDSGSGSCH